MRLHDRRLGRVLEPVLYLVPDQVRTAQLMADAVLLPVRREPSFVAYAADLVDVDDVDV